MAVFILIALVASASFNAIYSRHLQKRFPVPGGFYKVNGYQMHLYCSGKGSPTVVFESGGGNDWLYWQKVQPEVAKTTRVCSYDRAGLGWSAFQNGPRDAKNIATQAHALLQQAGETGPLLLVGASAGGFYVRQFTGMYPAQVVGVALVDSSVPEQFQEIPGAAYSAELLRQKHREARWEWLKEASGWARLRGHCKGEVEQGLEAYAEMAQAETCRPPYSTSAVGEWDEFWHAGEQAREADCCGNLPVMIISQDPDRPKQGWTTQMIAVQPIWNSLQESLKRLSPRSRRIIARNSRHHVMIDRPDVIINNLQRMIFEIRNKVEAAKYGTTVEQ